MLQSSMSRVLSTAGASAGVMLSVALMVPSAAFAVDTPPSTGGGTSGSSLVTSPGMPSNNRTFEWSNYVHIGVVNPSDVAVVGDRNVVSGDNGVRVYNRNGVEERVLTTVPMSSLHTVTLYSGQQLVAASAKSSPVVYLFDPASGATVTTWKIGKVAADSISSVARVDKVYAVTREPQYGVTLAGVSLWELDIATGKTQRVYSSFDGERKWKQSGGVPWTAVNPADATAPIKLVVQSGTPFASPTAVSPTQKDLDQAGVTLHLSGWESVQGQWESSILSVPVSMYTTPAWSCQAPGLGCPAMMPKPVKTSPYIVWGTASKGVTATRVAEKRIVDMSLGGTTADNVAPSPGQNPSFATHITAVANSPVITRSDSPARSAAIATASGSTTTVLQPLPLASRYSYATQKYLSAYRIVVPADAATSVATTNRNPNPNSTPKVNSTVSVAPQASLPTISRRGIVQRVLVTPNTDPQLTILSQLYNSPTDNDVVGNNPKWDGPFTYLPGALASGTTHYTQSESVTIVGVAVNDTGQAILTSNTPLNKNEQKPPLTVTPQVKFLPSTNTNRINIIITTPGKVATAYRVCAAPTHGCAIATSSPFGTTGTSLAPRKGTPLAPATVTVTPIITSPRTHFTQPFVTPTTAQWVPASQ